ncbi:MAG: sigma 54-dependent Fis family transcriptional regulator [Deltaproteobacteria bacterium]|nr:sigma 54-dependent Fis family transcriptional regulator [Deltaproteobacteria bacterium]MBW2535776.1 sigma 54-dependent Fis family transcriptional regulator [Deltaproteobacteria bacterium]
MLDAAAEPSELTLRVGRCIVGSAPTADIVIADKTVSRNHLELGLLPEGVDVRDLGSRNGTFYAGQRVERMVLGFGGRLTVGSATLVIAADTAELEGADELALGEYRGIVGSSAASRKLFAVLQRLEGSLVTVLVEGDSGVGKERVARALHLGSRVAAGPFVAVNCGALPRELIASELFGHRRGAFSGAFDSRRGAFESAHGGTLLLDEIGELPLELQPVLLRALELGEVRALGDDHPKQVKVRVIVATNRDLEAEVRQGRFRQDLFYRLAVVRIAVPPLRERLEDVAPLARHFAAQAGLGELAPDVILELEGRSWPGNVRELQNAVAAFAALGSLPAASRVGGGADLDLALDGFIDPARPFAEQKEELLETFTRRYLTQLLERTGGNQSEAARVAGLNRNYLGRLLGKHGLGRGPRR